MGFQEGLPYDILVTTLFDNPDFFGLSLTVCPSHELKFLDGDGGAVDLKELGCYSFTDHKNSCLPYHQYIWECLRIIST